MILTEDIFLGALALVRGGELLGVEIRGMNGRRMAVFRIEGKGMEEAEREYYAGAAATVNVQMLKFQVRRLKDRAFDALRKERRDGFQDQPGADRGGQGEGRSRGGRR